MQLVPRAKNWARATIVEVINNRTYKVQTIRGGIYWRNRRLIKPRHSDSRQSLKTAPDPVKDTQHSGPNLRPRRSIKKPERLIESMNWIQTQYRDCNHNPGHSQNFARLQYRGSHNTRIHKDFNHSHGHSWNFRKLQYEDSYNTRFWRN